MATEGKAATARFATPWDPSIVDTIFACSHIVMEEDSIQTDPLASLPANTLSGLTSTSKLANAVEQITDIVDDELNHNIDTSQATLGRSDNKTIKYVTASAASDTANSIGEHSGNHSVGPNKIGLSKAQKRRKNRAEKQRRNEQANSIQSHESYVEGGAGRLLETSLTPKRPPLNHSNTRFPTSTKASLGWQTERAGSLPSSNQPWKPAGSSAGWRPGSVHQTSGYVSPDCTNSQTVERPSESLNRGRPHDEAGRHASSFPKHELQEAETLSEVEQRSVCGSADSVQQDLEPEGGIFDVFTDSVELVDFEADFAGPDFAALQRDDQVLRTRLYWAEEGCKRLQELRVDIGLL